MFYNLFAKKYNKFFLVVLVSEESLVPVMLWNSCAAIPDPCTWTCTPTLMSDGLETVFRIVVLNGINT